MSRFNVVKLLGDCGAYKEKGVPVMVIMLYIFNLMFSPMSMYYQIKMGGFRESFSKNTVYRFLDNDLTVKYEVSANAILKRVTKHYTVVIKPQTAT